MNYNFKSIFKDELTSFIDFIKLSVVNWKAYQYTLSDLDSFLHSECLLDKKLDAKQLARWLGGFNTHISTKKAKLSQVRRFSRYISALGITVSLPELPRNTIEFKPYVFSADEMTQIFEMSDDLIITNPVSRISIEFPELLRILYGCGLRLGEATSLKWDDINTSTGVISVRVAKNKKQRIVPMNDELTRILSLYRTSSYFNENGCGFLFVKNNGQRRSNAAYGSVFRKILYDLGIRNSQNTNQCYRGPCIHSLRHTFTFNSLLKAESEGRGFMETVPFLSTYLGHERLMYTDRYLKARYELYTKSHAIITDYTCDVFPQEV